MKVPARRREDARQNRSRILSAAEWVFENEGVDAPLNSVITRSGVSSATFFRHFADRKALLSAILEQTIHDLEQEIAAEPDANHHLVRIVQVVVKGLGARPGLTRFWLAWEHGHASLGAAYAKVEKMFDAAIGPAKASGQVRPDLTSSDMMMFCTMIGAAIRAATPEQRAQVSARALTLLSEGFALRNEQTAGAILIEDDHRPETAS